MLEYTERPALDPIWVQAADDAIREFRPGDLISHDWIRENLRLFPPDRFATEEEYRAFTFRVMDHVDAFRNILQVEHNWFLANKRGVGYVIVPPTSQTGEAMRKFADRMYRETAKAAKALVYIDLGTLSDKQITENTEARNRIAFFRMQTEQTLEDKTYRRIPHKRQQQ